MRSAEGSEVTAGLNSNLETGLTLTVFVLLVRKVQNNSNQTNKTEKQFKTTTV